MTPGDDSPARSIQESAGRFGRPCQTGSLPRVLVIDARPVDSDLDVALRKVRGREGSDAALDRVLAPSRRHESPERVGDASHATKRTRGFPRSGPALRSVTVAAGDAPSALDEGQVDDVRRDEPGLELVPAEDVAHQEVVRAPVAALLRPIDGVPDLLDDRSWASSSRWIIAGRSSAPFGGRSIVVSSAAWRGSPTATPPRV